MATGKAEAERVAQAQHEAWIEALSPERRAAVESLERQIKRLEDKGSKSLYLRSLKERLRGLRDGTFDRSFGDIYASGPGNYYR